MSIEFYKNKILELEKEIKFVREDNIRAMYALFYACNNDVDLVSFFKRKGADKLREIKLKVDKECIELDQHFAAGGTWESWFGRNKF